MTPSQRNLHTKQPVLCLNLNCQPIKQAIKNQLHPGFSDPQRWKGFETFTMEDEESFKKLTRSPIHDVFSFKYRETRMESTYRVKMKREQDEREQKFRESYMNALNIEPRRSKAKPVANKIAVVNTITKKINSPPCSQTNNSVGDETPSWSEDLVQLPIHTILSQNSSFHRKDDSEKLDTFPRHCSSSSADSSTGSNASLCSDGAVESSDESSLFSNEKSAQDNDSPKGIMIDQYLTYNHLKEFAADLSCEDENSKTAFTPPELEPTSELHIQNNTPPNG